MEIKCELYHDIDHPTHYTQDEIDYITGLIKSGKTMEEIISLTGRTYSSIYSKFIYRRKSESEKPYQINKGSIKSTRAYTKRG